MKMAQVVATIISNRRIAPRRYAVAFKAPALAKKIVPGQFVHVKCGEAEGILLRRPFSVHRILKGGIEILYEVVGAGTEMLTRRKAGDTLDLLGPLGHGFDIGRPTTDDRRPTIIIAGGMGAAPLVALAERLVNRLTGLPVSRFGKIKVLIGAKTKSDIVCEKDFKRLGCEVQIATDDGSKGKKGLVTALLEDLLRYTTDDRRPTIYACGPTAMLKAVARMAGERRLECQVSLEERMACGVGVCLGCPVKVRPTGTTDDRRPSAERSGASPQGTTDEYKMVCKDGPVFDAGEIIWG